VANELVNPYDVEPETVVDPNAPLVVPFEVNEPDNLLNSETAAGELENLLPIGVFPNAEPADAAMTIGSAMVAPIVAGAAGWAGKAFGAVPGGETSDEKGDKWYENTKEALTYEPKTYGGGKVVETVGNVMGGVEKAAKYVGSGYAALGAGASAVAKGDFGEVGQAMGRGKQEFMEQDNALAEGAFQVFGSPAAATIAAILPEIASLGLVKPGMRKPTSSPSIRNVYDDVPANNSMRPGDVPEGYGGVGKPKAEPAEWAKPDDPDIDPAVFRELQDAVQAKNVEKVAEIINANPAIVSAFDELGVKYMPQMVSESGALRNTASGLKTAVPALAAADEVVGKQLRSLADDMVNRYGSTDRMSVEQGVRDAFDADIKTLGDGITQIYDDVLDSIPQGHQVDAGAMRGYIEKRVVEDLGGGDLEHGLNSRALSKHERDLWELTHKRVEIDGKPAWEADSPTYAEIDAFRRDVGEALTGQGPYGNNRVGEVKKTYAELARTQQKAANDVGPDVGQAYREANQLGEKMHGMQSSAQTVLGRNLDAGMVAKIDAAANNIVKGNAAGFKKLMDNVPASQRESVAMSILDRIMTGSAGSEQITEIFLKNMNLMNRNPGARNLLFSHLPKEAIRRYKVIETASRGFLRSLAKDNKSNTAQGNAVREAWENGGLWAKLTGGAEKVPWVGEWVTRLAEAGPANRVAASEKFLTSPAMDRAARLYIQGKTAAAEKAAMRSAAYNRWIATLDQFTRQKVQKEGVLAFLFTSQVEDNE